MRKMQTDTTKYKHTLAVLAALLVLALLQTVVGALPRPWGATAFLLIPAVVAVGMAENELPALLYGLFAGLLWDCGALGNNFHGIFLCTLACGVSAFVRRKMFSTAAVALLLSTLAVFGYLLVDWLHAGAVMATLWTHTLPSFVYTLLFSVPLYALFQGIANRWRVRSMMH
ncbi:MAG: hypothetical protein LBN05_06185 [Oscillospiraceae bacterium]|jgi:hypothetical protein|nr:hypothetical protein [Oscillospiraceae bacterium]